MITQQATVLCYRMGKQPDNLPLLPDALTCFAQTRA